MRIPRKAHKTSGRTGGAVRFVHRFGQSISTGRESASRNRPMIFELKEGPSFVQLRFALISVFCINDFSYRDLRSTLLTWMRIAMLALRATLAVAMAVRVFSTLAASRKAQVPHLTRGPFLLSFVRWTRRASEASGRLHHEEANSIRLGLSEPAGRWA